jgi:hypothetical protein
MPIPTELVGSLPRPMSLQQAYQDHDDGKIDFEELQAEQDKAAEDSIKRLGHHRQLPRLTRGPFRYKTFASEFVEKNKKIASKDVKQAVIAPSMLMLLYPLDEELDGYPREDFLSDLVDEVEQDIRRSPGFARDVAMQKIAARLEGARMASEELGV